MNKIEHLQIRIEEERSKLDEMVEEQSLEESYKQSVLLDGLIEEYIRLTN